MSKGFDSSGAKGFAGGGNSASHAASGGFQKAASSTMKVAHSNEVAHGIAGNVIQNTEAAKVSSAILNTSDGSFIRTLAQSGGDLVGGTVAKGIGGTVALSAEGIGSGAGTLLREGVGGTLGTIVEKGGDMIPKTFVSIPTALDIGAESVGRRLPELAEAVRFSANSLTRTVVEFPFNLLGGIGSGARRMWQEWMGREMTPPVAIQRPAVHANVAERFSRAQAEGAASVHLAQAEAAKAATAAHAAQQVEKAAETIAKKTGFVKNITTHMGKIGTVLRELPAKLPRGRGALTALGLTVAAGGGALAFAHNKHLSTFAEEEATRRDSSAPAEKLR